MIGFNKMKSLYDHSPGLLKGGIDSIWGAIPDSVKYGSRYRQYTRLLKQSQWWSRAQMDQYQIDKLKSTLIYSYEHIPFYILIIFIPLTILGGFHLRIKL